MPASFPGSLGEEPGNEATDMHDQLVTVNTCKYSVIHSLKLVRSEGSQRGMH